MWGRSGKREDITVDEKIGKMGGEKKEDEAKKTKNSEENDIKDE